MPELLNVVMLRWLWFMTALPTAVEIEPLPVTVKLHPDDEFVRVIVSGASMTVSTQMAHAALLVKQKLTPNVTANVRALSLDARAWVTLAFKKFCCFENTIAAR